MQVEKVKSSFKNFLDQSKGVFSKVKKIELKNLKLKKINLDIKKLTKLNIPKLSKKIVNKKRFVASTAAVCILLILLVYIYFSGMAYAVSINGNEIGKVRNKKDIENLLQQEKGAFKQQHNAEIGISGEITYKKTRASDKEIMSEQAVEAFVTKAITYTIQSYSIVANGATIAALKTQEEANQVLDSIKANYVKEEEKAKYKEITFAESVQVKQEFNEEGKIMALEDAASFIIKGTDEDKVHKVVSGESLWSISRKYNISIDDLQKANPKADPNKIKIGQELNLVIPKPLLSVKTVEAAEYTENIPFEQTVEFSPSLYKDQTSIKVKGAYGERSVAAEIVKINGIEDSRSILSEKVIKEPKTQIIVKGTKELPPKKGTGTFSMPTRGTLTSRFGSRWGSVHEGIDLATPIGTPVKAADGGVVTWAGSRGSYGNLVIVDHGGGYATYYGHLSKIHVKVGTKVYKGQKIAASGNTGRSTGPHVHFEIKKNGKSVDPLKYLK
jgi:murein DD-endopeptidase MepM/ murein hydrolase activator NlpD